MTSPQTLHFQQGSLYPALHRLERKGLVTSEWRESGNGLMAKFYSLTPAGRKHIQDETAQWSRFTASWPTARRDGP